ncbi:acetate non-utilizing protein 9 [Mortierella alpina]|uniref:Succinate dehydrogenase assembly factor 3 n=1 Tax=Mortierella alpina TaxID=64518 RepID=A0A9P6IY66_MORAP|nr:acetate non-utilizing protein 9 [Mortierella alpina]
MASQKTLVPPLVLYRQILRAHRVLPSQFRILGDGYVKSEFHRHKDQNQSQQQQHSSSTSSSPSIANNNAAVSRSTPLSPPPQDASAQDDAAREATLQQIVAQAKPFGKKLDPALLDKMTDQQLGQLFELRKEAKGLQSQDELAELAKEEAQLFEKVAAALPPSALSSAASS